MKLLLLQPPVEDFYETPVRLEPLGLCLLKAAVLKALPDWQVIVKDFHEGWARKTLPIPKPLAYLRRYYAVHDRSPFCTFHHYYHLGASYAEIAEEVFHEKPDVVGISSLFSAYSSEVIETAKAIKSRLPVPILAGGSHASALPGKLLESGVIDYVILGEGEKPLVEFLRRWSDGPSSNLDFGGIAYPSNGSIQINPPEASQDGAEWTPDYSDFPPGRYLYDQKPIRFILTSKGCPYRCDFCSVKTIFGPHYRRRSNAEILRDIQAAYEQGIRVFDFEDDHLTHDRDQALELFRSLKERYLPGDIQLVAMNGICYWHLDHELLSALREAGFSHLNLALVTSNSDVSRLIHRPLNLEIYQSTVQSAFQLGFKIVSYQILGLPQESLESMMDTLCFSARQPVLLGASIYYEVPGSRLAGSTTFSTAALLRSRLTALGPESSQVSRDELYTLFVLTRMINFFKAAVFEEKEVAVSEVLTQFAKAGSRTRLGGFIFEKLLNERKLFAVVRGGWHELEGFKADLFEKVWGRLKTITTQAGNTILLSSL